ncbi:hypothetical protein PF010_g12396 [Phytophthora fragariae]|uniref:Uncharacterized protein n=1 Tax=Phytophthora fragariae TaxID=53985 RepID=A0A6A4DWZ3_9STRA|nr:hypothetical protein PF003_g19487 [Phytophthora fragariae]KAE9107102.1 hypothetical protein PF010_g12396 [Phytophthora fragariae]KAE9313578.1 hypothetical protein PF001_g8670 [Phytophthora fragariae]
MVSSISVPTTSNAPSAASSSLLTATSGSGSASATSGGARVSLLPPAATGTPLAVSGTSTPLAPRSVALLQLAAAAGGSSVTPLVASTLQTASTVQYTPTLGVLTRLVPRLGAGTMLAPAVAQVSASIFDIRRGEAVVGIPDGLSHSVPVPHFSEEELARLSALGGVDAVSELLQANPLRPVNFSDAHVRLAAEREMLALSRCFHLSRREHCALAAASHSVRFDSGGSANYSSGFSGVDLVAPDCVCGFSERVDQGARCAYRNNAVVGERAFSVSVTRADSYHIGRDRRLEI